MQVTQTQILNSVAISYAKVVEQFMQISFSLKSCQLQGVIWCIPWRSYHIWNFIEKMLPSSESYALSFILAYVCQPFSFHLAMKKTADFSLSWYFIIVSNIVHWPFRASD